MKKFYYSAILSFLIITAFSQNDKRNYSDAFKLVEVWLEAQKDYEQLPGITAIVVEDQEVLWSGGFGMANMENGVKADPSTLFSICSISKLFTSVAIMKLYDEGKLRLDDQVGDLLPWYNLEQKYPESGSITVKTLLTHSSGLPREAGYPYWTGPDFPFPTREQIKLKLSEQETLYPSSNYFQYSNLGLTLLGEIVEEVSGQPYDVYIIQNILEPLNLRNTRTKLPESLYGSQLAVGYSSINRTREREKVNFFQAKGIKSAAGFSSSVEDLGKFASWQFRLMDSTIEEVLKPSTLKYMQRVHWTDQDWKLTWGLGFSVKKDSDGNTLVGHGGSCPGYRSVLRIYPKNKRAFAVMINASGTSPEKYAQGINEIINKVETPEAEDPSEDGKAKKDLQEYVGYYNQQPWWDELYISTWQEKLVSIDLPAESPGKSMTFYKHIEDDIFQRIRDDGELGETLTFERNSNGKIIRLKSHGNYLVKKNK